MKKVITILLTASLSMATMAYAKEDDAKKKSAAKGPQPKQQQVKAGPRIAPNSHVQTQHVQTQHVQAQRHTPNANSANVNPAKIQKKELHEQQKELRKSNVVTTNPKSLKKQQQTIQSNQLPAVQNNQRAVVTNPQNAANIQRIRSQYQNFKARPNPATIPSVQYNQNYRIENAQNWSGPQYRAFQTYRPQWHDQGWWQSNYASNLLLIGGGWYYWNSGYWYPAWGYDSAYSDYPYDGPIYVGEHRRPFDEVVADVQATLQEQGYYRGEVDGLMGPLTRTALADFQRDHGLISTAALDQPTLASLGLG